MKTLIASVLVSAAVATAASAGGMDAPVDNVVDDVYDAVPVAASSSGLGATGAVAVAAGVILVGAALASSSGTD
ncbi:hypothetical protein [uncultured Pelagimonas sp.]|uniref:hypothetical protein n=1 Tax=uncultured Pelagimonas sp. TaxID=1618102 RepID=UPI0026303EA7|nr:hypothetical protein [uncultured Pelagimonas sp.]